MNKPDLAGRRILVVEDDFLLCVDICQQINDCGGVVVGPAPTLKDGFAVFQEKPLPDGSILNIRLGSEMAYPLADDLLAAGIPVIFASSENKAFIPEKYASIPLVPKPIDMMIVVEKLFPNP